MYGLLVSTEIFSLGKTELKAGIQFSVFAALIIQALLFFCAASETNTHIF